MSISNYKARGVANYLQNRDGHIAVVTALIGLPLLLMVSVALDMGNASRKRANIGAAIDAAALAAVLPANLTDIKRKEFAQKAFTENYFGDANVSLDISAVRERVDIVASSQVPTLLSSIVGKDYVTIKESTSAIVTVQDVVCVLALDPTGIGAIKFTGNAKFNAPACSVQVNSSASQALIANTSNHPTALSFCVTGTSSGNVNGTLKHGCSPIADPYAYLSAPTPGACVDVGKIKSKGKKETSTAALTLSPGTYCNGIDISGVNVTFEPGTYIIPKGKLRFKKGSQSVANGVTFVLMDKVPFWMEDGSSLELSAPSTGDYAGIAIFQPANAKKGGPPNRVRSGGSVKITGTVYLPKQKLEVSSDSPVLSEAPATAYIAYSLEFKGQANVKINVDHEKGGIPPLLPRSDEGARLVSNHASQTNNNAGY